MKNNKLLQALYTVFLGVLIAIFIGVGVSTFYEAPKPPKYESSVATKYEGNMPDEETILKDQQENERYTEERKEYARNVSIILMSAAVVLVVGSIMVENKGSFFSDGIMLGGLITLVHSIIRGGESEDSKFLFVATTIGLLVVLYLGYHRFAEKKLKVTAKRKK